MRFRFGCLVSTAGMASQMIFSAAPLVLTGTLKIPPDRFGLFFAADALAVVAGSLLNSWLCGRVSETSLLATGALCLLLAAAGFKAVTAVFTVSAWGFLLPAAIGSAGFALLTGTDTAAALSPFCSLAGIASAPFRC